MTTAETPVVGMPPWPVIWTVAVLAGREGSAAVLTGVQNAGRGQCGEGAWRRWGCRPR